MTFISDNEAMRTYDPDHNTELIWDKACPTALNSFVCVKESGRHARLHALASLCQVGVDVVR
jgi:hypothetical protein